MRFRLVAPFALAGALLAAAGGPAEAIDRRVRVLNDSTHGIVAFHAVNVGAADWAESLLGEEILAPGASKILSFDDGSGYCRFRFRAVFDDGVELVRESVNICDVGTYRYTD